MASADFSQFVVTTANGTACETSRDKPASLSSSGFLIYAHDLRLPFGFHWPLASLSVMYALCQVSVYQVAISLSLLLTYTLRCKSWQSLWVSSATTPFVDFHHRLTACPSYTKTDPPIVCICKFLAIGLFFATYFLFSSKCSVLT